MADCNIAGELAGIVGHGGRPRRVAKDCVTNDRRDWKRSTEISGLIHRADITGDSLWREDGEHATARTHAIARSDGETVIAVDAHDVEASRRELDKGPGNKGIVVHGGDAS